ncbi:hypothetical protein [Solicola gregarius]|uniref:Uncharacterized protein n=1 Tax=Solicola gregarius TaxID=2908642 RepID=A0AA46YMD7_9ACTN|nr:hypothetical protein [Solicola gregarius]UYM05668.1 hypothetical protein L0C25_00895 [Solicola gregarius]
MGLRSSLRWWSARRPHVLLIEAPGAPEVRLAVEAWCQERGGVRVATPADADLLVVAGTITADLTDAAAELWRQMPGPRARVDIDRTDCPREMLDAARTRLADSGPGARDDEWLAGNDRGGAPTYAGHAEPGDTHTDPGQMHPGDDRDDPNADGHGPPTKPDGHEPTDDSTRHAPDIESDTSGPHDDHASHDGHTDPMSNTHHTHHISHSDNIGHTSHADHMGHDMAGTELPAGLGMADRAADRDGLKLDVLPVMLGPVMAYWPTGLAVALKLQGDVIQQAAVRGRPEAGPGQRFWEQHPVASRLDRVIDLVGLLGWDTAAVYARMLRDRALAAGADDRVLEGMAKLSRRARRSPFVRLSLRGLARVGPEGVDAYDRLLGWLAADTRSAPYTADLDTTCALMVGRDIAEARLVVASMPPDLESSAESTHHLGGGGR